MKKFKIHLFPWIASYQITASCQLLRSSLCRIRVTLLKTTTFQNFQFMEEMNLTRFDNMVTTFD